MPKEMRGIIVPVVTPFHANEDIDEEALRRIVNYLIDNGVHGIFPVGGQSEFFALTADEKKRVIDVIVEEVNGRVHMFERLIGLQVSCR